MTTARLKLPYYPRMFLAPNGKLFFAAPPRGTRYMDPAGRAPGARAHQHLRHAGATGPR